MYLFFTFGGLNSIYILNYIKEELNFLHRLKSICTLHLISPKLILTYWINLISLIVH